MNYDFRTQGIGIGLVVFFLTAALCAADPALRSGDWSFTLNPVSGELHDVAYRGEVVFTELRREQVFGGATVSAFTLKKHEMENDGKTLRLLLEAPGFELTENYRFDDAGLPGLLGCDAELKSTGTQPVLFGSWIPAVRLSTGLDYYMPAALFGDVRPMTVESFRHDYLVPESLAAEAFRWRGNLRDLPDGTVLKPSESGGRIILLRTPAGTAISVLHDERTECVRPELRKESADRALLRRPSDCEGWAMPAVSQKISPVYLYVQPGRDTDAALNGIHDWYRAIGATVPADRPDWVAERMVYEFQVDHGMSPDDLNLLESELIPRIKGMNYNLAYIQPVAEGRGNYLPVHHRMLNLTVGSLERYRKFLETMKDDGLRVWQDIVPHGSNRNDIKARGNSVFQMAIMKDGQVNPYLYIMDYLNPAWRNYMQETAAYWSAELPIDGFRIDMPYGSPKNFRRRGFPAQKPELVEEEWWRSSLEQAGGEAPALEYARASLTTRQGGLRMVELIRDTARKHNPDAAVLAEVLEPFQGTTADAAYDLLYDVIVDRYVNMEPELFVSALSRYFYEREKISLPGQLWLRVFQSHDVTRIYNFLGTAAGNCAYATCVLSEGLPLLDKYMDIGHGNFIARLQGIRKIRPELNSGRADYLGVKAPPGVWTVLREKDGQCSIGLVNFTNRGQSGRITLPASGTGLESGRHTLVNAMTGEPIAPGTPEKPFSFAITLAPYEVAVLVSVPAGSAPAVSPPFQAKDIASALPVPEDGENKITLRAPGYVAVFDRAAGLLTSLSNSDGTEVMKGGDLLFAERPELGPPEIEVIRAQDRLTVEIRRKNGDGTLNLTYHCFADRIELDASLSGDSGGIYAALSLPMADYRDGDWRATTMDGLLDDHFWETVKPSARFPGLDTGHRYRDLSGTVLWNSEVRLPDYSDARAGMYDRNGQGFEILVADPLRTYPAMIQFRRRLGEKQTPGALLYLKSPSILTAGMPDSFRVTLRCGDYRVPWPRFSGKTDVAGVTLSGESSDYIVENPHYRLALRRLNGAIRELADRSSGKVLLRDFHTQRVGGSDATPGDKYDIDAGARFFLRGETLMLRTAGTCPRFNSSPPWTVAEYAFDSAAGFRSGRYLMPREEPRDVAYRMDGRIPPEFKGAATRKKIEVRDEARVLMTVLPAGYYNVYRTDGRLKMFAMNKKHWAAPGEWMPFGVDFQFRDDARLAPLSPEGWLGAKSRPPAWNPNLDVFGFAWSVTANRNVWHRLSALYPDFCPKTPGSIVPFCGFDREDTYHGTLSALLPGGWSRYNYDGSFTPWFQPRLPDLEPGNYQVRFAAKFQNVREPRSPFLCHLSGYDENNRLIRIPFDGFPIPKNADWKIYELQTREPVPSKLRHAEIFFGVNCRFDAFSRISNIEVKKIEPNSRSAK